MAADQPTAHPVTPVDQGPKSYLAMMLLAFFAAPSGLARAYRGEQIGWVRFWIFVGSYVAMIIPFVNLLAGLALCVLAVWGIIDFFLLYKVRTDARGIALTHTPRDLKFSKGFFIVNIVGLCLMGITVIFALIFFTLFAGVFSNTIKNGTNDLQNSNSSSSSDSSNYRDLFNSTNHSNSY